MRWSEEKSYLLCAVMFFTRIPVRFTTQYSDFALNKSRKYFPLVGIIIGSIAAFSIYFFQLILPISLAIILSTIITIVTTGAFHEDGLADCCDAFGAGWDKTQILTIMKDSRIGSYGTVGLVLILGLKVATLIEIGFLNLHLLLICCINAHAISRLGASLCVDFLDYVQDTDESKIKPIANQKLNLKEQIFSFALIFPAILSLGIYDWKLLFISLPIAATLFLSTNYFKKKIGGYTGDCLGAIQQILEVIFYLSVVILTS